MGERDRLDTNTTHMNFYFVRSNVTFFNFDLIDGLAP